MADQVTAAAVYLLINNAAKKQRKTKRWSKRTLLRNGPRLSLLKKIDADDTTLFQNFTRMSHTDFENLLELVTPHIQRQETNYHDSISQRMRLAITLRFLATADDAFALTINFMKPYAGQLSQSPERVFNYRLSRARRIVEYAFGIMAFVFRVFPKPMQLEVDKVEKITKACVYLHNYLRKSKTSRSLYTPSGSFDNEDLENGTIIPGTWRSITQNDAGLICLE
nr:unnamed protein product [Callosobruchus analis]